MDYHIFKSALNNYFARFVGRNNRPVFFNIDKTYPSLNRLTKNFCTIKTEFDNAYKVSRNLPKYHEIDPGESAISNSTENNWNVFMLYLLGHNLDEHQALCKETTKLIKTIPNLMQAFFSILEPGKSIPLHEGPYLGYLRYHLALHVPNDIPPSIYVNSQKYTWQEGQAVLFDDSWPHKVENESQQMRVVLIVDVLRPMPKIPTLVNKLVTNVIARYTYGRQVVSRAKRYSQPILEN